MSKEKQDEFKREWTAIPVRKETRKKLKLMVRSMDDNYDVVVNRLIDFWESHLDDPSAPRL